MGVKLKRGKTPLLIFTILTIDANSMMAKIHDRTPVIIRLEDYAAWINTNFTDITKIQSMVPPYPERFMEAYPVSRKVNSPQHNSPDLMSRDLIEPAQELK